MIDGRPMVVQDAVLVFFLSLSDTFEFCNSWPCISLLLLREAGAMVPPGVRDLLLIALACWYNQERLYFSRMEQRLEEDFRQERERQEREQDSSDEEEDLQDVLRSCRQLVLVLREYAAQRAAISPLRTAATAAARTRVAALGRRHRRRPGLSSGAELHRQPPEARQRAASGPTWRRGALSEAR